MIIKMVAKHSTSIALMILVLTSTLISTAQEPSLDEICYNPNGTSRLPELINALEYMDQVVLPDVQKELDEAEQAMDVLTDQFSEAIWYETANDVCDIVDLYFEVQPLSKEIKRLIGATLECDLAFGLPPNPDEVQRDFDNAEILRDFIIAKQNDLYMQRNRLDGFISECTYYDPPIVIDDETGEEEIAGGIGDDPLFPTITAVPTNHITPAMIPTEQPSDDSPQCDETLTGSEFDDSFSFSDDTTGVWCITDLGGNDLINLFGLSSEVRIDLSESGAQAVTGNLTLVLNGDFERVLGSQNAPNTIIGNDANNSLLGGNFDDLILGMGGDDIIRGGNGNDTIEGGDGDDYLAGGNGDDQIYGDGGNDRLRAGPGNDFMDGGEGDDDLVGRNGRDVFIGGSGIDKTGFSPSLSDGDVVCPDIEEERYMTDAFDGPECDDIPTNSMPTSTSVPSITPTPTIISTPTQVSSDSDNNVPCLNSLSPRLQVGSDGYIVYDLGLAIRIEPAGEEITRLGFGVQFTVLAGPKCLNDMNWWQVELDSGEIGWVPEAANRYLIAPTNDELVFTPTPAGESDSNTTCTISVGGQVNVRTGPGTSYSALGQLSQGQTRDVIGQATSTAGFVWWQIGENEWVREDVVDLSCGEDPNSTTPQNPDTNMCAIELDNSQPRYQRPSFNGEIIGVSSSGDILIITGYKILGHMPWYRIDDDSWIVANYFNPFVEEDNFLTVDLEGNCANLEYLWD